MEVTITTENLETLKNGDLPLVVDFWARSTTDVSS